MQRGAVADWWYSWPKASTLASLCLSQRWTFWTYDVTINLFSRYLMKYILHAMLDATGVILILHYKSMKCDVLFSQGSVRTKFRWGEHFSYVSKKIIPLYNSAQIIKIDRDFPKLWSQMYCHLFMVHSVYLNQSINQYFNSSWQTATRKRKITT